MNLRLLLRVMGFIMMLFTRLGAEWILEEKLKVNRYVKCKVSKKHPSGNINWAGG